MSNSVEPAEHLELHCLQRYLFWVRGYKTFFMLNSAEHEIFHANKSQIT